MKEDKKDFLCISISTFGITFLHLWAVVFPYYCSFCYLHDRNTRVDTIYSAYLFFQLGLFLSSIILPYLFCIFGIRQMYLYFSLIELLTGIYSQQNASYMAVCIVVFQKAFLFQAVMTAANLILTEKFQNGMLKAKYLAMFRLAAAFLFAAISQIYVNKGNLPQNIESKNGEYFFPDSVSENFGSFLLFYSVTSSVFLVMPYIFVQNPESFQSQVGKFVNYLRGKSDFRFNMQDSVLSVSNMSTSQIIIQPEQKSSFINNSISGIQDQLIVNQNTKNKINDELKIVNIFGITVLINLAISYYATDTYKYIALVLNFQDQLISAIFMTSTFFFILSNQMITYFWGQFGFDACFLLINFVNFFALAGIIVSKDFYIIQILFSRFGYGAILLFQDLFCYGLFEPNKAMKYIKYMMFYGFLGGLLQIILNFLIFSAENYKLIHIVLLILSGTSIFIYFTHLKNTIHKPDENQFNFYYQQK